VGVGGKNQRQAAAVEKGQHLGHRPAVNGQGRARPVNEVAQVVAGITELADVDGRCHAGSVLGAARLAVGAHRNADIFLTISILIDRAHPAPMMGPLYYQPGEISSTGPGAIGQEAPESPLFTIASINIHQLLSTNLLFNLQ
jgi:hypothetical protein